MAHLKDLIVNGASRFLGRIYAPAGMEGTATKAEALTTNAGSSTIPVFFENGVPIAITSYSGKATSAGTADVATKLGTASVGSTSEPIYLNAGVPTKISYKIEKSVPSNAVFTDTTYSAGTGLSLSGTTFNHSNSVTAVTTAVFKKITYDSEGHITGTADVSASDLPSHTHSYIAGHSQGTRLTSANLPTSTNGIGAIFGFVATATMTEGKPPVVNDISNAHILQMNWDNNQGYDSQIAVYDQKNSFGFRSQSGGTWGNWAVIYADTSSGNKTYNLDTLAGKSTVSISRDLTSGTKIGTITIDGTATDLYCQTNTNTDTKVTQTETTTDANYEVLFSETADNTTRTEAARKSSGLKFNPNYKRLTFAAWEIPDITGSNTDLNSYTDASGNYKYRKVRCITTGGGTTISNKPADSPFVLEIILIRWASNTDYITKQIYHCYNKKTYQRFCTNGTWDAWTEIKTTDTNTTYTFATGSTQGAFSVTPSGGTAQSVKIFDLGEVYTKATNHESSTDKDWNNYTTNGWHMAANAANSPDSNIAWWIAIVSRHNEKFITQDAWSFTDSANNIAKHYVRRMVNSTWGQWNEVKYTDTTYDAEKGISLTSGKFGHSNTAITALSTTSLKKVAYDEYGHITATSDVVAADLPEHTHNYVPNTKSGVSTALNLLDEGSGVPSVDNMYIITGHASMSNNTFYKRQISLLWDYFKTKISLTDSGTGSFVKNVTQSNGAFTVTKGNITASDLPTHDHNRVVGVTSPSAVPGNVPTQGHVLFHYNVNTGLTDNMPTTNNANAIISISKHDGNYTSQLGFSSNGKIYYRSASGETIVGKTWKEIAFVGHSHDNATTSKAGFMSADDKTKLDGIAEGATKVESSTTNGSIKINGTNTTVYTHPSYTAKSSGLYKVTVDATGHISAATAVAKSDITALGIPGSDTNTTYTIAKGDALGQIKVTPSEGDAYNVTVKGNEAFAYGTCDTAAATAAKVITISNNDNWELNIGSIIVVKFSKSNSASNVTLNVNSSGAKSIWYNNAVYTSTGTSVCGYANRYIYYMYDGTYWVWLGHSIDANDNNYDRVRFQQNIAAKSAITSANIIVADDKRGYFHLKTGNQFDITYPILYAGSSITAAANGNNNYMVIPFTVTTTQSISLSIGIPVFIKGSLSGTKFTPISTTPLTQTIPTSDDGYEYILLGFSYSSTAMYLLPNHPIYAYRGGSFAEVLGNSITDLSIDGQTITYTRGDGSTGTLTTQDTNTTYSAGTGLSLSGTTFNHSNSITAITTAAFKKFKYDAQGHITGTSDVVASDLPAHDHSAFTGATSSAAGTKGMVPAPPSGDMYKFLKGNGTWGYVPNSSIGVGDRNYTGYMSGDAIYNEYLSPNRFAGAAVEGITVEYSIDGGTTWSAYQATNGAKRNLFTNRTNGFRVGGPSDPCTANSCLRITLNTGLAKIYTDIQKIMIYISTNYSKNCKVTIKAATHSTPTVYDFIIVENMVITGWSGWNTISKSFTTYGNTGSQYENIQFTFTQDGLSDATKTAYGLMVYTICGFGGVAWTAPSNMAINGHVYSYDGNMNVTFPASVTGNSFSGSGALLTSLDASNVSSGTLSADRLPTSDVTAGSYGPSSNASPEHGGTFSVPYVTVDNKGRVTAASTKTITLPAQYVHPTYTSKTSGLYKITVDSTGHVSAATAVVKADITGLGIPGSDTNTTYTLSGAYGTSSDTWVTTLTPLSGTATTSTVPKGTTSAYGLMKLIDSTSSSSTALAATANSVKSAYDLANGKSTVSISRNLTSGTKIGTITIDGTATDLYCQTNTNTDTLVKQTADSSTTTKVPILMKTVTTSGTAGESKYNENVTITPSAGKVDAKKYGVDSHATMEYDTTANCIKFIFD